MGSRADAAAIGGILHPRLRLTLAELGCVRTTRGKVVVDLVDGDAPFRTTLEAETREAAPGARVEFGSGDPKTRRSRIAQRRRTALAPGIPGSPTQVVLVGSGKGGVGKSSIAANLSVALARLGYTVGLLDADLWGSSIPAMLGVDRRPVAASRIVPPVAHGVKVLSTELFSGDREVMWRGPMLHRALEQFARQVDWGGPDFLLVDLPPGTGDVSLSVAEFLPSSDLLLVTTPQPLAVAVAARAAQFASQVGIPVLGVVENFAWFVGDDGQRYRPFGAGGGERLAGVLGVDLLAQLPLDVGFRAAADEGAPVDAGNDLGVLFHELALKIVGGVPIRPLQTT